MASANSSSPVRSQRDVRTARVFVDEHGRQWRATVNNLGAHAGYPVSPLVPQFEAPIYPPPRFLVIEDIALGRVRTNVAGWLEAQQAAHDSYELLKQQAAVLLYGDGAAAAIERGDRALYFRIGGPPDPVEQVEAYAEGHPYVLGFDKRRPKSLARFFPEPAKRVARKFLTAQEEEEKDDDEVEVEVELEDGDEQPEFDEENDPNDEDKPGNTARNVVKGSRRRGFVSRSR